MSRATAGDRMKRVLSMVPWLVAHPGVAVADAAARFGISEAELLDDLNVVWLVGLPPYTPDNLVDVVIEDGRVWIHYADFFKRPLKLTPPQALALLVSSDGLASVPGADADGALPRALAKLADALGLDTADRVDVDLGGGDAETLAVLRDAAAAGTEVEIDYYSYNRDAETTRRIAPWRVFADAGAWYVDAWCHLAEGERLFRIDRVAATRPTGEVSAQRPPADAGDAVFHPDDRHPRVELELAPDAMWVTEYYPTEAVTPVDDGGARVVLAVTGTAWLERLLVRLGPSVRSIAVLGDPTGDGDLTAVGADAAARVRARYSAAGTAG